MSLKLNLLPDGRYEATVTPPHVARPWSTKEPLSARALVKELEAIGCHQQDIGDALYEQDPDWVKKL